MDKDRYESCRKWGVVVDSGTLLNVLSDCICFRVRMIDGDGSMVMSFIVRKYVDRWGHLWREIGRC